MGIFKRQNIYYLRYSVQGKVKSKSTHSDSRAFAEVQWMKKQLEQQARALVGQGLLTETQATQLVELTQIQDQSAQIVQRLTKSSELPSPEEVDAYHKALKLGKLMGQERVIKALETNTTAPRQAQPIQPTPTPQPVPQAPPTPTKTVIATFQVISDRHLRSKETLASYANMSTYTARQIKHFKPNTDITTITAQDIEDYKYELMDGDERTPATVNHYLKFLKKTFDYACDFKHLPSNPFPRRILLPGSNPRETVLTFPQVAQFLANTTGDVRLAIVIGVYTAMRRGEITELRQEHIDRQTNHINIPSQNTKTKQPRQIPIHADLLPHIPTTKGKLITLSAGYITRCFHELAEQFKMPADVCFHSLRHTATTLLMKACKGNTAQVMKITGHKDERSLHRYTHLDYGDSKALMDQMKF